MKTFLAVATPLYLLAPVSNNLLDKSIGILFATTIASHLWIGLNYVATDYVPKISKRLLGPERVLSAALGVVTFVGLGKVALNERGG